MPSKIFSIRLKNDKARGKLKGLTDFERKVLLAVKKVPQGKVVTYKMLARKIKRPKAFRAVANALAKNPCLVKIPCHRVIRSDGRAGGYCRGSKQKLALLKKEGIVLNPGNRSINIKKYIQKLV